MLTERMGIKKIIFEQEKGQKFQEFVRKNSKDYIDITINEGKELRKMCCFKFDSGRFFKKFAHDKKVIVFSCKKLKILGKLANLSKTNIRFDTESFIEGVEYTEGLIKSIKRFKLEKLIDISENNFEQLDLNSENLKEFTSSLDEKLSIIVAECPEKIVSEEYEIRKHFLMEKFEISPNWAHSSIKNKNVFHVRKNYVKVSGHGTVNIYKKNFYSDMFTNEFLSVGNNNRSIEVFESMNFIEDVSEFVELISKKYINLKQIQISFSKIGNSDIRELRGLFSILPRLKSIKIFTSSPVKDKLELTRKSIFFPSYYSKIGELKRLKTNLKSKKIYESYDDSELRLESSSNIFSISSGSISFDSQSEGISENEASERSSPFSGEESQDSTEERLIASEHSDSE